MNPELNAAIWGAIAGALMSLLITIALPLLRRCIITWCVSISADVPHDGLARFRVVNGSFWTINDAILYITLDFKEQQTLPALKDWRAHIEPGRFVPLKSDQLCWSVRDPDPNPMKVSILAKERQPFAPCSIDKEVITIPSEEGWPSMDEKDENDKIKKIGSHARVFLRRQSYKGWLKFVSADTDARYFRIEINPDSVDNPCTIEPVCRFDAPSDV
jgi:hypothetical protein